MCLFYLPFCFYYITIKLKGNDQTLFCNVNGKNGDFVVSTNNSAKKDNFNEKLNSTANININSNSNDNLGGDSAANGNVCVMN